MSRLLKALIVGVLVLSVSVAEEAPETAQRDAHRAKAKAVAEKFQFADADSKSSIALVPEPVLRYTDETRKQDEAGLWICGRKGRPAAIMAIEFYTKGPYNRPHWLFEIASLSERRITAKHEAKLDWTAEKPGLTLQVLPKAGVPADQPARRLTQMRQLARRFGGHEDGSVGGAIELRLMANPLHRYSDEKAGLLDGAIFAFVSGTNPEIFVLLEAHTQKGGESVWKYSFAQMTGAVVSASLDDKEVWNRGEADPPAVRESYVNGWLPAE